MKLKVLAAACVGLAVLGVLGPLDAAATDQVQHSHVKELRSEDFLYGTYIIDTPGVYQLAEDISFNPNSPATLTAAVASGLITPELADMMGLPEPPGAVDAYHAGAPLFTQFDVDPSEPFTPGGPTDSRYDPAAFGLGFFAAIVVTADGVVIDLNGHTLEQSAEHALLQRFFAVIELADQPFVPTQGPAGFGGSIESAKNVVIKNGTIGRSAHHGIHGNGNEDITIKNVDFVGYEVGAVALNGVNGLVVEDVTATNRKDIPVLGTFSSAQFIKPYLEELVRSGSPTTLSVDGELLTAEDVRDSLRSAINNSYADIIASPNIVDGRPQIDSATHPVEYALFNNPLGLLDGNSYSFLINSFGVAVDGFPHTPDGVTRLPSENVRFHNVHVIDQAAFVNEIVAIDVGGGIAAIDPVGAVFQIRNVHPDTGLPITISDSDDSVATYIGNPVANAQAFVAKAAMQGAFAASPLDISRLNIPEAVLDWVEGKAGSETLADAGVTYVCNGDSMFHVDKGVIAFKMDAARDVQLVNTSVDGLTNLGAPGSPLCGDYRDGYSHSKATLPGYGGAMVRGYTFAGSQDVTVLNSSADNLSSSSGSAIGFDILTDSAEITFVNVSVDGAEAGIESPAPASSPSSTPQSVGVHLGADCEDVSLVHLAVTNLAAQGAMEAVDDEAGAVTILASWPERSLATISRD